ncbi:MAG: YIP1 family protein [Pyrinomonadaceae bacterium]
MRRIAPFVVFGIGLLVLLAGIIKVLPGGIGLGAAWMFWGLLMFGLSFIPRPVVEPTDGPELSAIQRVFGMFYMPGAVFASFRRHPSWLLPLIIVTLISGAYSIAFNKVVTPERIADQMTTKTLQSFVDRGWMTADMVKDRHEIALKQLQSKTQQIEGVFSGMVTSYLRMAIAGAVMMLLVLIFGGRINYWQAFSVSAYASLPIVIINKVISFPLLYVKDPTDIHPILNQDTLIQDNLGVLLDPANNPVLFVLAATIGVLSIYRLWLSATGLRNAGEKVSSTAAWATTLTIFAVLLGFVVLVVTFFPGSIG